ncbi:hypothetical protein [Bacillus thuringiensis]|uniref:hypothetical protein n=1 Tax=Bacillus thuringiensis TaxID=1428 RepID=UPI0011A02CA6|nr:hypothetical protein [Bacillus thuringiensis]
MLKVIENKVGLIAGISLFLLLLANSYIKNEIWFISIDIFLALVNLALLIISRKIKKTNVLKKLDTFDEIK